MPLDDTEPTPDEPPRKPSRSSWAALGWGMACAVCAGGVSLAMFVVNDERITAANSSLKGRLPDIAITIAVFGIYGGLLGGSLIGLTYPASDDTPRLLALTGTATGAVGGGFVIPAVILCREWISPFATTTLYWCAVGFLAGLASHRLSRRTDSSSLGPKREAGSEQPANPTAEEADEPNRIGKWVAVRLFPVLVLLGIGGCVLLSILTTRY